ncbi:MAG: glycosyltransferase, partial [Thermodesulfovibrionales bacterium]
FKGKVRILDVGSYGVNGTYREIFSDKERFDYTGLDLTPGPNVDYVPSDPYEWEDLPDESFDVIISGQAFEHIEYPWLTIREMKKKLKVGGIICIIAPSRGPEHRYPVDCWRYYPDGFKALAKWAGLEVIDCKTTWGKSGFSDGSDQWGDTLCMLRKGNNSFIKTGDGTTQSVTNKNNPLGKGQPDYYFSIARKEILELVNRYNLPTERILEIGCAGGATGKLLKEKFKIREYIGVDISEEAGVLARQFLDRVIIADIEKVDLEKEHGIRKGYFDLILCLDVLEHLYNPWDVLASLKEYLKDNGYLIASIPNIQNISIINNLINGRWEYEKAGILDATHLRFFTREGIKRMFEGAGLRIERLDHTVNPQPDISKIKENGNNIDLGKVMIKNLTMDEVMNFFAYQYIVTSRKSIPLKKGKPVIQKDLTSIIILTFNQLEYTKRCVESIKRHTPEPHEIIFIDNGSKDGTVDWLRRLVAENENYRLIENKENRGFAAGCNQGIREAKGEYILLLNNDVIVTEGWLNGLLYCLKKAPDAGIVGPMTNNISGLQKIEVDYEGEEGIDDFSRRFRETYYGRRVPLRRIVGFCMLFRRDLIDRIGLLDESFGTGNFEDDDLCLRAELEGFKNYIAGDVFIHHYGSRSFIGNKIDYNATMGGNRKRFNEKWNAIGIDMESSEGMRLLCLRILERAEELYNKGKYEQAIKALIAGLKREPENKRIIYSLTEKLIELKQYEHCLNILKEFPVDDMRLSLLKGYCFEGLDNIDEALRIADEALSIERDNPLALNLKGIIHYKKGDRDSAYELFSRAIEADPGYGEPYTNLGVIEWSRGNQDRAIELLERGFKLSPTVSDIASLYHSAISQAGLYEQAGKIFEEAVRLYPLNRQNTFFLIDVLLKQEKLEKVMDIIEKAIVRFGIDDEFAKAALSIRRRIGSRRIDKTTKRPTLSLCMIVKNEERYLAQCLESVKGLVDEMIIVDTGSEDRTKEIAEIFGARVFEFQWNGDFSEARNFSLSKAEGDWIL